MLALILRLLCNVLCCMGSGMSITSVAHQLRIKPSKWRKGPVRLTLQSVVALTNGDVPDNRKGGLIRVSL